MDGGPGPEPDWRHNRGLQSWKASWWSHGTATHGDGRPAHGHATSRYQTFVHQPLASGPQLNIKKGFHNQIQSCNRKHITVVFLTEMTVSGYKLDHLAINSSTAVAGKAGCTYNNLWPRVSICICNVICICARWPFLIVSVFFGFWTLTQVDFLG